MIACFLFGVQYCCVSCSWCLFLRVPLCTCCVCFAFTLNGVLAKKLQKKTKSKNESPCCLLLSLMMLCGCRWWCCAVVSFRRLLCTWYRIICVYGTRTPGINYSKQYTWNYVRTQSGFGLFLRWQLNYAHSHSRQYYCCMYDIRIIRLLRVCVLPCTAIIWEQQ